MSTTNIHLSQFKIQCHLQKRRLWIPVHQNTYRRKNRLKFLTSHLPFCFSLIKIIKLFCHPGFFGIYFSWWNHQMRFKMQNPEFVNLMCVTYSQPIPFPLTLKWSRGVPMDSKISFCASARKRRVSWRWRFLTFTCLPPRIFWHVFEKNRAARCAAIALGSLWTPRWPPTGRHSTKIIFHIHVTFDRWWLYTNVDLRYYHISIH